LTGMMAADSVKALVKAGFNVNVEKGAGALSQFPDAAYEAVGAKMVSAAEAFKGDIVTKVCNGVLIALPNDEPARLDRSACLLPQRPPRSRIGAS
jgi:H+-translocating NAD(P) transhydrogenase subunit alpha